MINLENKSIIMFDGVCNLCNNAVQFIIKRDTKHFFLFTSLQSDAAKEILLHFKLKNSSFDSIILIENNKVYQKSTAIVKIAKNLSGIWKLGYSFIIIPSFIRDLFYDLIAKHRYNWFGKKDACMIPTPALKSRFLN